MSSDKNNLQYSKIAKLFHWGFVLLFVYGVAKQVDDINQLDDQAFFRFEIIFAVTFLFLIFFVDISPDGLRSSPSACWIIVLIYL